MHDDTSRARSRTETRQGETQQTVPRMPHERDESADSQSPDSPSREPPAAQGIGRAAHADQARGLPDTSRSTEADATYHRLRETPEGGTPQKTRDQRSG